MPDHDAILFISASETDSNLYYVSGFLAGDPFCYVQVGEEKVLIMSDLELGRARDESKVDAVLSYTRYEKLAREGGVTEPQQSDICHAFFQERGVKKVLVPSSFGVGHADRLRGMGYELESKPDPFFPERLVKSEEEVAHIAETQTRTERALEKAIDAIRNSEPRGGLLMLDGEVLTAERIKKILDVGLMEEGCVSKHTIVAPGAQGADPHNTGSGPLRPDEPIVIDVFPQSSRTRYWADMTRTVVKGKASDRVRAMYDAVLAAQETCFRLLEGGAVGAEVHQEVQATLKDAGFVTEERGDKMVGFFHGTGHGVGLDIHEPPRIGKQGKELPEGTVVTVEPGLYYPEDGGVRIEDLVVVTADGCRNLTKFPKELEV